MRALLGGVLGQGLSIGLAQTPLEILTWTSPSLCGPQSPQVSRRVLASTFKFLPGQHTTALLSPLCSEGDVVQGGTQGPGRVFRLLLPAEGLSCAGESKAGSQTPGFRFGSPVGFLLVYLELALPPSASIPSSVACMSRGGDPASQHCESLR